MEDHIFEFWSAIASDARIHPRDKDVLLRMPKAFDLRCLPSPFSGPLRTAKVVLLYLSPGFDKFDLKEARSKEGQRRYADKRRGYSPLSGPDEHRPAWEWWSSRTKRFGHWEELRHKLAILNIGAYHSKSFSNYSLLAALPSSRVTLDWTQSVLFPQGIAGERVVVAMRSAEYWGLGTEKNLKFGRSLFVPEVTRSGYMRKGNMRDKIVEAVKSALTR